MARCDLRPHTFKTAMGVIQAEYGSLGSSYHAVIGATDQMKKDWHTPKGYEKVNDLRNKVANALTVVGNAILNNYGEMSRSAKEWAREEKVLLNVPPIANKTKFDKAEDKMGETEDAHIDDAKLLDDAAKFKTAKESIYNHLQKMIDQTASNDKFGYTSTTSSDPRAAMHKSLTNAKSTIETAVNAWEKEFSATVDADKTAIETALQTQLQNVDL